MPRTLRVEYAQGICRRHLKNSIILQRHVSFAKSFGPNAVLVWFTVEVWSDRCRANVTQACTAGGRGAKVVELNVTIIKGDIQASGRRPPVEAVEAGEADARLGTNNVA